MTKSTSVVLQNLISNFETTLSQYTTEHTNPYFVQSCIASIKEAKELLNKQRTSLLHPAYEPGDGTMDGAQLVDGDWWHPVFGCDSLDYVVNNYWNEVFRERKAPMTPISVDDRLPTFFEDSGPIYGEEGTYLCWWWRTDGVEDFWEPLEWDFRVLEYNKRGGNFQYTHWLPHYAIIAPLY